ncbi:amidase [Ilyonectria destructans]|nr:amidase [Ilyonectria destructans]
MNPYQFTATEGLHKVQSGDLTVEDWASSCQTRIWNRDGVVKAWAYINPEFIKQARYLDEVPHSQRGLLHGLPVTVKDIINVKGMPTQYGCRDFESDFSESDSSLVRLFRERGALILGKATTTQYGASSIGPDTCNPHDPTRTPGGSSSGSAAAVADGQAALGIGTQTGGSTIRPASFTGNYAVTFTVDTIPTEGQWPFAKSFDRPGFFARDLHIFMAILDVFKPDDVGQNSFTGIEGARFAVCKPMGWEQQAGEGTRAAIEDAAKLLRKHGATVEEFDLPTDFHDLPQLYDRTLRREAWETFVSIYYADKKALDKSILELLGDPRRLTDQERDEDTSRLEALRSLVDKILGPFTAIIAPSAVDEAPIGLENTGSYWFNKIWNALGVPMVNIPGFKGKNGMPIGVTLIAPRNQDRYLLDVAKEAGKIFASEGGWKNLVIERE